MGNRKIQLTLASQAGAYSWKLPLEPPLNSEPELKEH